MKRGLVWGSIIIVAAFTLFSACGAKDNATKTSTDTGTYDFTTDIKPILTNRCVACHATGSGKGSPVNFTTEAGFKASTSKAKIDNGSMPEVGSPEDIAFTSDEQAKLTAFLK